MKTWYALTCTTCGFRHTLRKFTTTLNQIAYPVQLVTGGGRGSGFRVLEYLPWSSIPDLRQNPEVWRALNCEYLRLSSAYDNFHHYLGFLSPNMSEVIDSLNREIFRLRALCRELKDQRDRLLLTCPHGGGSNEFGRILEEISKREEDDRRSALALIK
jgi:hypothetical protein